MTALRRRPAGDIWQGLYEPWLAESIPAGALPVRLGVKHVLTHRILYADFYLWEVDKRPPLPAGYQWMKEEEATGYGHSRLIDILLERLGEFVPEP